MDTKSEGNGQIDEVIHLVPKWTRTPPTEPGWYWTRNWDYAGVPEPAHIRSDGQIRVSPGIWMPATSNRFTSTDFWPIRIEEPR